MSYGLRLIGVGIRFDPNKFAIIIGLCFNWLMDIDLYLLPLVGHRLRDTYFNDKQSVTYGDLIYIFECRAWVEDNCDAVKLALLYYLHLELLGSNNKKLVFEKVLKLPNYVWWIQFIPMRSIGVHMTYRWICSCIDQLCIESDLSKNKVTLMR